jgi:flagellin FlaB
VFIGTGYFTAQTAQGTINTGKEKASSNMELMGNVIGIGNLGLSRLNYINVTVTLTTGGTYMDLSQMVVSYTDNYGGHNASVAYEGVHGDGGSCTQTMSGSNDAQYWCISQKFNNVTTGAILENNAKMVISVGLPLTAIPNTKIKVNFQPENGAVLPITRTVPNDINLVQLLY